MWNWVSQLNDLQRSPHAFFLTTVIGSQGSAPRDAGAKMIVLADGTIHGTIGGGRLEALVIETACAFLKEPASLSHPTFQKKIPLGASTGQCCGGSVEVLFELMNQDPLLYIFGAGHVGQAIAQVMHGTPYRVHLIDPREEWIFSSEVPSGVQRFHGDWEDFVQDASHSLWSKSRTNALILTHRHDLDQQILESLLKKEIRSLGLIGSRAKWGRFQQRLLAKGFTTQELSRVTCPIGLPIGGKAPKEIALSVGAELLMNYYGKARNEFQRDPVDSVSRGQILSARNPQRTLSGGRETLDSTTN